MNIRLRDKDDIKIFILYLMAALNTPLTFAELNDVSVCDGTIGAIDFAECFGELLDSGCITEAEPAAEDAQEAQARYLITGEGRTAASQLRSRLLVSIRDRSLRSALRLLNFRSTGAGIHTESEPLSDGRCRVTCEAAEGGIPMLRMSLVVDSPERAEEIRDRFNDRPEHIYRAVFALLTGGADFLLDL